MSIQTLPPVPDWVLDVPPVEVARLEKLLACLRRLDPDPHAVGSHSADAVRIDELAVLERVRSATAAAQARVMAAFDTCQRAHQQTAGVPASRLGRGVADQIALALGISPSQASQRLGQARALVRQMPHTLALLSDGDLCRRRPRRRWCATPRSCRQRIGPRSTNGFARRPPRSTPTPTLTQRRVRRGAPRRLRRLRRGALRRLPGWTRRGRRGCRYDGWGRSPAPWRRSWTPTPQPSGTLRPNASGG